MKEKDLFPECLSCLIHKNSIFKDLNNEEIELITIEKTCHSYKKGELIYNEGNRIKGVYCINKGIIKVYKTGVEGKEQIIKFAKSGDIIGFRSVLSGENACTSSKVLEDSILCYIPSETLFELIKKNPSFSINLLKIVCKELGEANEFITDIAQKSAKERLAEVLVVLKNTFELDNNNYLQISLTREELSNLVGSATESVIRLLSEFKTDNLIELEGRKIKILNIQKLQKIANVI